MASRRIQTLDDTNWVVSLERPARRIVSLVPAATEILFALDAGERIVGRTRYGVHPPEAAKIPSVGGGIRPDPERLLELDPDLVIIFAGADNRSSIAKLRSLGLPVFAIYHNSLADLYRNTDRLGALVGAGTAADSLSSAIRADLDAVGRGARGRGAPLAVYFDLSGEPAYTIGRGSYLDTLIQIAGGQNVFNDIAQPSAMIGLEALVARSPDCVVTGTSESADAALSRLRGRPGWSAVPAVERGNVVAVDPDLLYRLGPRIGEAAAALSRALAECRAAGGLEGG